ncbi:protein involved in formation of curli polymers [Erythrobacter sp. SG61-1L]|uniref:CsgG/HfaB family protein n=1 Tax=Erythrobacter sp. SG61-1L TaxID=1603897 RepID=UPI0006C90A48|nr:CsgG/HfaB family protein [Erythrobacter sp. SG61-1L]KPL68987.1 protein involved in formation of curli polymers [Erythrobacter sp. SG61-1L]
MRKLIAGVMASALVLGMAPAPAFAKEKDKSSARKDQEKGTNEIPRCTRKLGTLAIVEPDDQWWREYNLGSPEAIIRIFVQRSGCFTLVNRGGAMQSRNMERALADSGELQEGSNLGKGQVKAADYFLQPDIISTNNNSGGGKVLGGLGGLFGGTVGAIAGGISVKKGEANVTLSLVDARTTEEVALEEGYFRKKDLSWGAGGGLFSGGVFGGAGAGGYQNTEIGQIIVLAYLDAYTKLIDQLGGLPEDASAAAPEAQ